MEIGRNRPSVRHTAKVRVEMPNSWASSLGSSHCFVHWGVVATSCSKQS